jgi:GNAT superfamily N-acetyltransferase
MIRPGTPEDAEAVARVQIETWRAAYAHLIAPEQIDRVSLDRRAEFWRDFPPLVAELEGEVIGFAAVGPADDDDADGELYAIYVRPENWGTGTGRALMEAAEERLRELGHRSAVLWVLEDNPRARAFYVDAGWKTDGQRKQYDFLGETNPVVRYAKQL